MFYSKAVSIVTIWNTMWCWSLSSHWKRQGQQNYLSTLQISRNSNKFLSENQNLHEKFWKLPLKNDIHSCHRPQSFRYAAMIVAVAWARSQKNMKGAVHEILLQELLPSTPCCSMIVS